MAVPSETRLILLVFVIYLAPTGTIVTSLPRATRTTGPVGTAWPPGPVAPPAAGAGPSLLARPGTVLRSGRHTETVTLADRRRLDP